MGTNQPFRFHIPAKDSPREDPPQLGLTMNHLLQFAHTVSAQASLTFEQKAVEARLAGIQQEREKWRNYHSSFVSLSEDQEKEINNHKTTLNRIKLKQREHLKDQENVLRVLATTILATQASNSLPDPDGKPPIEKFSARLETLEAQVPAAITTIQGATESNARETNSKMNDLEKAQEAIKVDLQNFKSTNFESQRSLSKGIDDKIAEVNDRISDMDVPLAVTKHFNDFGLDVVALGGKVTELSKLETAGEIMSQNLRDMGKDVQALKLQMPTYDDLADKHATLDGDFRRFHAEVAGDGPENPSLFAMVESFEESQNQFKEEIQQVHLNIAAVQDEIYEIKKTTKSPGLLANSNPPKHQLEDSLSAESLRLSKLELTTKEMRTDAELKDEMVAEEFGKIEQRVTTLSDQHQDLLKTVTELQNQPRSQVVNSTETRAVNGIHAVEMNGVSHAQNSPNAPYNSGLPRPPVSDKLREHDSVLESHYNFIVDLQSRLNNLTSDEIAEKMVLQMQKLYPYASSAQNEIAGLRHNFNMHQVNLNQVRAATYNLENQAKVRENWDLETRKVVESTRNDLAKMQATVATANDKYNSQLGDHESRLENQGADVIKYNQAFENVKLVAALGESIAAWEKKLGSVETDVRKDIAKVHSKVMLMWNERPKEHAKMASPITTSPSSASPTASPSASTSPRKTINMRLKDKSKERMEDGAMAEEDDDEDPVRIRKRPRVEANYA